MTIIKAFHVRCNQCQAMLMDADSGRYAMQRYAIEHARKQGWTHGKQGDICPRCQKANKTTQIFTKETP